MPILSWQGGEAIKRHKLLCVVRFEPEAVGAKRSRGGYERNAGAPGRGGA